MEFYKVLQSIMEEKNMSISEIAKASDLSDSTVRSIISRKSKNISLEVAFKLSKGLGVTLERLNGDEISSEGKNIINKKENNNTETSISIKERKLLNNFNKLNETGKDEAIKRVSELTLIPSYKKDEFKIDTIAAHNDHLDEEGEMENIMKDLEDMDKW
ncbi:helix-turn-helix domain-containing protein [Terrisporobacter mayombei]|uniref:helix-turn-helix domain-containing protein n=1 Tax=Terrisporobacter mayombei TaxID=1541 RepID=UPI00265B578C|nr:helix-turn-helix transcriptional regulator [Terrisporobacter mayombei]MCC3668073.1 helix-turn-helix transcriptional regulator [Terrisporobacter mayombei]